MSSALKKNQKILVSAFRATMKLVVPGDATVTTVPLSVTTLRLDTGFLCTQPNSQFPPFYSAELAEFSSVLTCPLSPSPFQM